MTSGEETSADEEDQSKTTGSGPVEESQPDTIVESQDSSVDAGSLNVSTGPGDDRAQRKLENQVEVVKAGQPVTPVDTKIKQPLKRNRSIDDIVQIKRKAIEVTEARLETSSEEEIMVDDEEVGIDTLFLRGAGAGGDWTSMSVSQEPSVGASPSPGLVPRGLGVVFPLHMIPL